MNLNYQEKKNLHTEYKFNPIRWASSNMNESAIQLLMRSNKDEISVSEMRIAFMFGRATFDAVRG
ncbi:hypothetical protein T11_2985 [Trichinella zimbabwensis]|uniref:Uncharacterized protein n=1 Tax=Trichinella zimbabwensis TaxID=268475 RepID=A0A0V1HLG4_9BILA|nr:hypothetical protein T11_2985 [Trichinella zimbabwensis]